MFIKSAKFLIPLTIFSLGLANCESYQTRPLKDKKDNTIGTEYYEEVEGKEIVRRAEFDRDNDGNLERKIEIDSDGKVLRVDKFKEGLRQYSVFYRNDGSRRKIIHYNRQGDIMEVVFFNKENKIAQVDVVKKDRNGRHVVRYNNAGQAYNLDKSDDLIDDEEEY